MTTMKRWHYNGQPYEIADEAARDGKAPVITLTTDPASMVELKDCAVGMPLKRIYVPLPYTGTERTGLVIATAVNTEGEGAKPYPVDWSTIAPGFYGGTYEAVSGELVSVYAADGTELAEPVTYQVTPLSIRPDTSPLYLVADGGELTPSVTYCVDTGAYINGALNETWTRMDAVGAQASQAAEAVELAYVDSTDRDGDTDPDNITTRAVVYYSNGHAHLPTVNPCWLICLTADGVQSAADIRQQHCYSVSDSGTGQHWIRYQTGLNWDYNWTLVSDDSLKGCVEKLGSYKASANLLNPNTVTRNKRITISGQIVDQVGDYLSDYIPVEEGQILCWCKQWSTGTIRAQGRAICAYNSEKVAIPGAGVQRAIYSYTVPAGVSYVRVAIVSGTIASVTVEPEDVMVFLSDTETPASYVFEAWHADDYIINAGYEDNPAGGVDVNLFGETETLAKYTDLEEVTAAEDARGLVSVVRYSMADNVFACKETRTSGGSIYVSFGAIHSEQPFLSIPFTTLTAAFPAYVETLEDGRQYLRIESRKAILYDYETKAFSMVDIRTRAAGPYIILVQCLNGMLVDGVLFGAITRAETVRNTKTIDRRSRSDSEIYDFAKRVQSDQNSRTLTIAMMTDTHLDSTKHPDWDNYIDLVEKFGAVPRHCGINLAVHGGDILTLGYTDKTTPLATLNRFCAALRSNVTGAPLAILKGNHDDSSYGPKNGGVQTFNTSTASLIGPEEWGVCVASAQRSDTRLIYDTENPNGGYCYFDDAASKIRVIMLNTNDNPSTMADADNYKYNSTVYGFQERQLEWLAQVLRLADKSNPEDWAVYIISHIPIEYSHNRDGNEHGTWFGMGGYVRGARAFFAILDGYINGTSGTASETVDARDWTIDVPFDFTGRAGTFLGFLCGHMHADNSSAGIGGASAPEYGHRYIGLTAGMTFAAVTIDRAAGTISVRKYGGYNHITDDDNPYDSIIGLTDADVNEYGDFAATI